jgi:hypothetical protein
MFSQVLRKMEEMAGKGRIGKNGRIPPIPSLLSLLSFLSMMVLMVIFVTCSNSPVEEDNQDKEAPDLEKILKDMVLIPAGEFLTCLRPQADGQF